jgi:hypothetical protein
MFALWRPPSGSMPLRAVAPLGVARRTSSSRPITVSQTATEPVFAESVWRPNRPLSGFGVHLASKLGRLKSFVFSESCL